MFRIASLVGFGFVGGLGLGSLKASREVGRWRRGGERDEEREWA